MSQNGVVARVVALITTVCALSVAFATPAVAAPQYPDMRTLPPRDLRFARVDVSADGHGDVHNVLQFSNTVWNGGDGPLNLSATIDQSTLTGPAVQHVDDPSGSGADYTVGSFYYHPVHQHYHFDDWGRYELWSKAAWDSWVAAGRPSGTAPDWRGTKTTSCVTDEEFVTSLPGSPYPGAYPTSGCGLDANNGIKEGLSVGWGDTYDYFKYEQWIDLNQQTLPDGAYVLRSVSDPLDKIYESPSHSDPTRESPESNEGLTQFTIANGQIVDGAPPSGTISVNNGAASTSTTSVHVQALVRDDVSGVDTVRISNDGVTWASYAYGGSGSVPMSINWDLGDTRYGGSPTTGQRTVYAQFHDVSGKWSPSITDAITLTTGPAPTPGSNSAYAQEILGDTPMSWYRFNEASGTAASDAMNRSPGSYVGFPTLGAPGLLNSEQSDNAVRFSGSGQYVKVANPAELNFTTGYSLEAWIKPTAIPTAGNFASIVTRPESYSLQFNGPQLEFTVIQGGAFGGAFRHRSTRSLQARSTTSPEPTMAPPSAFTSTANRSRPQLSRGPPT